MADVEGGAVEMEKKAKPIKNIGICRSKKEESQWSSYNITYLSLGVMAVFIVSAVMAMNDDDGLSVGAGLVREEHAAHAKQRQPELTQTQDDALLALEPSASPGPDPADVLPLDETVVDSSVAPGPAPADGPLTAANPDEALGDASVAPGPAPTDGLPTAANPDKPVDDASAAPGSVTVFPTTAIPIRRTADTLEEVLDTGCHPACTLNKGVCNADLGRCDCPAGWSGVDCTVRMTPACDAISGMRQTCTPGTYTPITCACATQCDDAMLAQVIININIINTLMPVS
jgi:hypothetical protein